MTRTHQADAVLRTVVSDSTGYADAYLWTVYDDAITMAGQSPLSLATVTEQVTTWFITCAAFGIPVPALPPPGDATYYGYAALASMQEAMRCTACGRVAWTLGPCVACPTRGVLRTYLDAAEAYLTQCNAHQTRLIAHRARLMVDGGIPPIWEMRIRESAATCAWATAHRDVLLRAFPHIGIVQPVSPALPGAGERCGLRYGEEVLAHQALTVLCRALITNGVFPTRLTGLPLRQMRFGIQQLPTDLWLPHATISEAARDSAQALLVAWAVRLLDRRIAANQDPYDLCQIVRGALADNLTLVEQYQILVQAQATQLCVLVNDPALSATARLRAQGYQYTIRMLYALINGFLAGDAAGFRNAAECAIDAAHVAWQLRTSGASAFAAPYEPRAIESDMQRNDLVQLVARMT